MSNRLAAVIALQFLAACVTLSAQERSAASLSPRELARAGAWQFGDPGGMLFHTAFHEAVTTRFLLLKSALHSETLAKYLALDETQRQHVQKLRPVAVNRRNTSGLTDPNAQADEQVLQPDYFAFLSPDQLQRLDVMAFRFDGYSALTRHSLAKDVALSEASQQQIAQAVADIRERLVLPRFRVHFASALPDDIKFRDCYFAGAITTQLNRRIVDILADDEVQRLQNLVTSVLDAEADAAIAAVERLAPLPSGISGLRRDTK